MNKLLVTFSFFFILTWGYAQQEAQYSQFMHNKVAINPAAAGARGIPTLMALYRNQWLSFEGAPKSILMSFDTPLAGDKVGFGLNLGYHTVGIQESWNATMAYSYNLQINKEMSVRAALQGTLMSFNYNFSSPKVSILNQNDPAIVDTEDTQLFKGNFGLGLYYTFRDFYLGISVPRFFKNSLAFNEGIAESLPHIYGMMGVTIMLSESVKLQPALLTKFVRGAPFDMDLNANLIFEDRVSAGLSYRLGGGNDGFGESIDLLLFYGLTKELNIGLAYDFTLSELKDFTSGSFEILLRYDLLKGAGDIANPRFF